MGYREMLAAVVAAAGPVTGLEVLEVGCGTGNLLALLADQGPARLVGLDFSAGMLAPARAKVGRILPEGLVTLVQTDAVAGLGALPDESVDVIVVSNVLYALPDRAAFWAQASRVLRRPGRVVVSNPDRPGFAPAIRQQWRERGLRGFADPRLLEVFLLNVAIDAIASSGRYAFQALHDLAGEARRAGLGRAELWGRCYGGPVSGMNVVGVLSQG